jgi:intein/homing endonuclease
MKFLSSRVKISEVNINDLVLACDISSQQDVYRKVLNVMRPVVEARHQVEIEGENGEKLITSDTHPTAINDNGNIKYVKGGEIVVGDSVVSIDNKSVKVVSVRSPNVSTQYADFSIDEHENYYAGMTPDKLLLAHNSATVFYPIWHHQFDDLIVLKNNQGTEETRVRHMDYGVVLSAFFWRRFKNKEDITFFDPNEVPDLYEAFYKDTALFEELYVKYEKTPGLRKKTMNAEDVFKGGILKERTDTGRIYLVFIDNVMNQGPFDPEYHTIYQSNLCCVTGDTQVVFRHENGSIEQMSMASAVERYQLGGLTNSKIKSFKNGEVSWKNVSAAIKTKTVTELYEIEDETGNVLRCTGDHRVFTKNRGYVRADELVETDELCIEK